MLIVVALGGNALLRRGEPLGVATQRRNLKGAAQAIARLSKEHDLVITHGNGPQVGLLALQAEALHSEALQPEARVNAEPTPLDVLGAESEGMLGYLLEQEIRFALPGREVATLLTQVEVDPKDPAFDRPTKPIGPVYSAAEAEALRESRGWSIAPEEQGGYRRVVPSPEPTRIVELHSIRLLVEARVLLICAGGGGIPVARSESGALEGVEAVIDKDLSSAMLAQSLGADALLLLTDQPAVFADWPEAASPIRRASAAELRAQRFDPGSMGPKVEAACRFALATGARAGIGALHDGLEILEGSAGTTVCKDHRGSELDADPSGASAC